MSKFEPYVTDRLEKYFGIVRHSDEKQGFFLFFCYWKPNFHRMARITRETICSIFVCATIYFLERERDSVNVD